MTDAVGDEAAACPWCGAAVSGEPTNCPACGAALAQRESIGGLLIPGLTDVDPALEDFDKRPTHLRGPSPSQGMASGLIIGAVAGGPIGLMAIGGIAAVAAAEYVGAQHGGATAQNLADLGRPSDVLLQALDHAADGADPKPPEPDHAADDGGRSVWRDLPEPADELSGGAT